MLVVVPEGHVLPHESIHTDEVEVRVSDPSLVLMATNDEKPLKKPHVLPEDASGPQACSRANEIRKRFDSFIARWQTPACELTLQEKTQLTDFQARFFMWAGSVGAFRDGKRSISLDSRLSQAPRLQRHIVENLELLSITFDDVERMAFGLQTNREFTDEDLSDEEELLREFDRRLAASALTFNHPVTPKEIQPKLISSELTEKLIVVDQIIATLLRTAVYITKRAPGARSRWSNSETVDTQFDRMHLYYKYPFLAAENLWLLERLANANARTRQYLAHRRARSQSSALIENPDSGAGSEPAPSSSTKATIISEDISIGRLNRDIGDVQSVASSVVGSLRARFPPIPDGAEDCPIVCPLCSAVLDISGGRTKEGWQRHVLEDSEPYVCTFKGCSSSTFADRGVWFEHEMESHRTIWICLYCRCKISDRDTFKSHIEFDHTNAWNKSKQDGVELSSLLVACQHPVQVIQPALCPFCGPYWTSDSVPLHQYRSHVGQHLLEIALFALPLGQHESDRESEEDEVSSKDSLASVTSDIETKLPPGQQPGSLEVGIYYDSRIEETMEHEEGLLVDPGREEKYASAEVDEQGDDSLTDLPDLNLLDKYLR